MSLKFSPSKNSVPFSALKLRKILTWRTLPKDPPATVLFPLDFRPMITRADIVTSTTETPEAAVPSTPATALFPADFYPIISDNFTSGAQTLEAAAPSAPNYPFQLIYTYSHGVNFNPNS